MATVHIKVKTIGDKISEYVENHPEEIYIDHSDELSGDQIDKILSGRADEVRWEIEDDAYRYDDLDYYWDQCREETGASQDDIDDWLADEGFHPSYVLTDYAWTRLLRNTTVNISAIVPEAEWNFSNWAYGQPIEYSELKEGLKVLGIDPYVFREIKTGGSRTTGEGMFKGYFPKMPNRVPKVDPQELYNNMCVLYDGMLNFCLGDLENIAEVMSAKSKYLVFKKGTNIVMYDRLNGAGITEATLTEDLKIRRELVEFHNDTNNIYGIQSCYGFTQSYWREGEVQNG